MARILKEGMQGSEVRDLQSRLKDKGFPPGRIDGEFGPGTEAALIAFQKSSNLLADGIAGPKTLVALGLTGEGESSGGVLGKVTVRVVSKMFPFTPLDNIKKYNPFVLSSLESSGLTDREMVLMALSTIRAETESYRPIEEALSRYNTSPGGHPFDLYDNRQDLGNRGRPDGETFKGRGFIQLTGRANYTRYSSLLGLGDRLVTHPEEANRPEIAANLLAYFLKDKERKIKEALLVRDFRTARRIVNGGSHGLDRFIDCFTIGEGLIV